MKMSIINAPEMALAICTEEIKVFIIVTELVRNSSQRLSHSELLATIEAPS